MRLMVRQVKALSAHTVALCSGMLALTTHTAHAPWSRASASPTGGPAPLALDARAESDRLVTGARRLIVDALPEDRLVAQDMLIDAIRLSPRHTDAYAELSRFTLWQVSMRFLKPYALAQAAVLARHVRELDPSRPLGNYLLCEMMLALGQSKAAAELFEATRKDFPNHSDTAVFEARYFSESDPTRSLSSATKALAAGVDMDSLSPAISVALEQISQGDAERLSRDLKSFVTVYPDRWLWHRMGLSYREAKQFSDARRSLERAIALGNSVESRLHLGIMLYQDLGAPDAATAEFGKLLDTLRVKSTPRPLAVALVESHLALAQLKAGRANVAARHAQDSLMNSPSDETLVANLVEAFDKANALSELEGPLEKLVVANPEAAAGHIILSQIASRRKDSATALRHMSNAIAISPERDDLFAARALFRYEMSNYLLALADFERAIELRPDAGVHYYNRACMLALLGRQQEALSSLREAVLLDGQFAKHARTDKDLVSVLSAKEFAGELLELGVVEGSTPTLDAARAVANGREPVTSSQNSSSFNDSTMTADGGVSESATGGSPAGRMPDTGRGPLRP